MSDRESFWSLFALLALILVIALLSVACYTGQRVDEAGGPAMGGLRYLHDSAHEVSCWTISDGSISCLPDSEVKR